MVDSIHRYLNIGIEYKKYKIGHGPEIVSNLQKIVGTLLEFYVYEQRQNYVHRPMTHVPELHSVIEKMIIHLILMTVF